MRPQEPGAPQRGGSNQADDWADIQQHYVQKYNKDDPGWRSGL